MIDKSESSRPELKRSGAYQIVNVPAGKEDEAICLWKEASAAGFFFNSITGSNQASIDKVLAESDPVRIAVANMPALNYQAIYACSSIQDLILGYDCPWLDFSKLSRLTRFSAMDIRGDLNELPQGLVGLSLYGYKGKNLEGLNFMHDLEQLDLRMASCLKDLSGVCERMSDLSLAGCPRLQDITALELHRTVKRVSISKCSRLRNVETIFMLPGLRMLTLDKIPAMVDLRRVNKLNLDFFYVDGHRYGHMDEGLH